MLDRIEAEPAPSHPAPRPIALISDTLTAERVRPEAQLLATRWGEEARLQWLRSLSLRVEVKVESVEIVSGEILRSALEGAWTRTVSVQGRRGFALVVIAGEVLEAGAAVLLGSKPEELKAGLTSSAEPGAAGSAGSPPLSARSASPSSVLLRVFDRAGGAVVRALCEAWRAEQGALAEIAAEGAAVEEWRLGLKDADALICIGLSTPPPFTGRIQLIAAPETLAAPRVPPKTNASSRAQIEALLADVPVRLVVRLGRASLAIGDLAALQVGEVLALDRSLQDPLVLECDGVPAAFGRPVTANGAIGLEVTEVASARAAHKVEEK